MVRNWGHQPWVWWHNPGTTPMSLNPLGWTQPCPVQDSPSQGFSGTWHCSVAGGKETPKAPELGFASLGRTGVTGAVSTHLFGLMGFAKMGETPRQRLWLRGAEIFGSLRAGQNPLRSQCSGLGHGGGPRFPLPVGEVSWFVLFLLSLALSLSLLLLSLFLSLLHFCESNDALILPRFSLLFIPYLLKEEMPLFW